MSREVVWPEPGADEPRTVMHCGDPYEDDLESAAGEGEALVSPAAEGGDLRP